MLKMIVPFVASGFLVFGSTTSALDLNSTSPGVTPDQRLYTVDQLLEDFQLYLTTNRIKETEILFDLAKERLAEAQVMRNKEQLELINNLLINHIEIVALVEEQIKKLLKEEKIDHDILSEYETMAEEVSLISKELEGFLEEDILEQIKNQEVRLKQMFSEAAGN